MTLENSARDVLAEKLMDRFSGLRLVDSDSPIAGTVNPKMIEDYVMGLRKSISRYLDVGVDATLNDGTASVNVNITALN